MTTVISGSPARGIAMARMAESMLRALGGCEVRLLIPTRTAGDAMVRLAAAECEEIAISPVVVRSPSRDDTASDGRYELLCGASSVLPFAEARFISPEALFRSACAVEFADMRLRVEEVHVECFAGSPYLYRITAIL